MQCPCFPFGAKGACAGAEYQGIRQRSISVQQDQDQQDGRTEVILEPKTASPPAPLTGEDLLGGSLTRLAPEERRYLCKGHLARFM